MRRNLVLLTAILAVLLVATGCKNKPPLTPVRPAGPDSVALNVAATYTSWTTDPNRDDIRYVFDWADDAFDTTDYLKSGDTASVSHTWSMVGTYALRVKAQDENGNWSADWSDVHNVHVYAGSGSNPPNPPTRPAGPDSAWVDNWVRFSSSALDPDGDSVQLKFYWGDDLSSGWSEFLPGGTTVSDSVRYTFRGVKQVYAVARDTRGDTSSWSEAAVITLYGQNTPPEKPDLFGPARGIKDGPMYLFFGRARDAQGDNLEYRFFWGDGRSSNWTAAGQHNLPVPESTRYAANGTYSIRCVARDIDGALSDTSNPLTFEVVGEGEIIWALSSGECISSPAWATVQGYGAMMRPAVVIANTDGLLMAIDAWQGVEHYSRTAADDPFTSSPAVSEDGLTVYIGSGAGQLLAHSANGDQKWINPYPDTISGDDLGATPAVDGQNIYAAGEAGYVFRVSDAGANATPGWMFKARDDINSSPVLAGGNLVVCDDSGYVYFLNPATGAVVGEFRCDGDITASPAVGANGNIYVGTEQGTMYAISPAGALVWADTITPFAVIYSSAVIAGDGGIVFGADDGYLYKLDPANGQPMAGWPVALSTSGIASTAAICADGVIYVVTEDDMLHAVRNDGTPHWANPVELVLPPQARGPARPRRLGSADLSPSVLVDQHGIIYAASTINGIFAIAGRPAGRLATTAWPMFQHDIRHSGKAGSW